MNRYPLPQSLEEITRQKVAVRQELHNHHQRMNTLSKELLEPLKPAANKGNTMIRTFRNGMAILNGIVLGLRVMRKLRRLFILTLCLLTLHGTAQNTTTAADTHHLIVDRKAAARAPASPYIFAELRDALRAAEALQTQYTYNAEQPLHIQVAPSVYWIDDPDDPAIRRPLPGENAPFGMKLKLNHLHLYGTGNSPEETVVACNRGQTQGADGNFTMFHLSGSDIEVENLTFGNYCNVDLEYRPDPLLSRKKREEAIVQAQLILCEGDRYVARRCRFISRLNLCPFVGARRVLFVDCYFECTDDALCDTGVYLHCGFTLFSSKPFYVTQGTGAVFLDCDLHVLTRGRQYMVKAGSPVSMVDCRWTSEDPNLFIGWTQDATDDLRSYQHHLTLNGHPLFIQADHPTQTVEMEGKEVLKAYGERGDYNIYNLLRGTDGWDPNHEKARREATGKAQQRAMQLRLSLHKARLESEVESLRVEARPLFATTQPDFTRPTQTAIHWNATPTGVVELQSQEGGSCLVRGILQGEEEREVCLTASTDEGLQGACVLMVRPRQLEAPHFTQRPRLHRQGDLLTVEYGLQLEGHADRSDITWYRCTKPTGADAIAVAVTRGNTPERSYRLTAADNGYYLMASVAPRHSRSLVGEPTQAISSKPIEGLEASTTFSIETDFHNFPSERQDVLKPGFWTVDSYKPADTQEFGWTPDTLRAPWFYAEGIDGAADVVGLQQGSRGARLRYTPVEGSYGDMILTLTASPCKSAGQGFGSATGQYLDVCLKFDTHTLSGYGVRIIRTPKNDRAVDFLLVRYERGRSTPLTAPISAICYRKGFRLQVAYREGKLTATATNDLPLPPVHREGLQEQVLLSTPIEDNDRGGILIQHTGSIGASATLLTGLRLEYPHR